MAYIFTLLILLANLLLLKCQEDNELPENHGEENSSNNVNPSYSFSYGVSDVRTGDIKTAWEAKEGDTVKGHYSVLEPNGSMRTVEYSARPESGFTAVVTNNGERQAKELDFIEEKSLRDYQKVYDFTDDSYLDTFNAMKSRNRPKHPFDTEFVDYSHKKRPKYPPDLESSDYTHSITIKHPYDITGPSGEAESHMGINFDPNCKTKTKKQHNKNLYANDAELELTNKEKYTLNPFSYKEEDYEKYYESSNYDTEKLPYNLKVHKAPKDTEENIKPSSNRYKISRPFNEHDSYPIMSDIPEKYYPEDIPPRPKKKYKPHKNPEFDYLSDDLDDYILVPKKKYKQPPRLADDYQPDIEEEYDRPANQNNDDDRYHRPHKITIPKESSQIVRKIVKKKRPPIYNLLDILDI